MCDRSEFSCVCRVFSAVFFFSVFSFVLLFCMFLLLLIVCADCNLHVSRFAKFIDRSAWAAQRQRHGDVSGIASGSTPNYL